MTSHAYARARAVQAGREIGPDPARIDAVRKEYLTGDAIEWLVAHAWAAGCPLIRNGAESEDVLRDVPLDAPAVTFDDRLAV